MAITGIHRVAALTQHHEGDKTWRFGNGRLIQLSPQKAALITYLRPEYHGGPDFVDGAQILFFDNLQNLEQAESMPLGRNTLRGEPASGDAHIIMRYPLWSWFVPLGTCLADGRPHPHAGTGFGLQGILEVQVDTDGKPLPGAFNNPTARYNAFMQLAYDDDQGLRVTDEELWLPGQAPPVPSYPITLQMTAVCAGDTSELCWTLDQKGMGGGIADGEDMLMPAVADRPGGNRPASGLMRWQRRQGRWEAVHFTPIAISASQHEQYWHEPSIIRLEDGSLLFTARPRFGPYEHTIRIWHSTDGVTWQVVRDEPNARTESPVTLNRAADGTPFLAYNPWYEIYRHDMPYTHGRRELSLRPLDDHGRHWSETQLVRRANVDPAERIPWMLDHPIGETVRLADGHWHHLLLYRSLYHGSADDIGHHPLPYGLCIDRVDSDGPTMPTWRFSP